jgi:hypothetical protein
MAELKRIEEELPTAEVATMAQCAGSISGGGCT